MGTKDIRRKAVMLFTATFAVPYRGKSADIWMIGQEKNALFVPFACSLHKVV
jgi:hypothetical protein